MKSQEAQNLLRFKNDLRKTQSQIYFEALLKYFSERDSAISETCCCLYSTLVPVS